MCCEFLRTWVISIIKPRLRPQRLQLPLAILLRSTLLRFHLELLISFLCDFSSAKSSFQAGSEVFIASPFTIRTSSRPRPAGGCAVCAFRRWAGHHCDVVGKIGKIEEERAERTRVDWHLSCRRGKGDAEQAGWQNFGDAFLVFCTFRGCVKVGTGSDGLSMRIMSNLRGVYLRFRGRL